MSTTLTIRNLAEPVKRKLRLRAANHNRSMEAEARAILAASLLDDAQPLFPPANAEEFQQRLRSVTGVWKDRSGGKPTDEIMRELRDE